MSDLTKTQLMAQPLAAVDAETILRDIGRSMRRVEATSAQDPPGLRVIWHSAKMRTELTTWESLADKSIDRQELSFFGKMVEYSPKTGVRTGTVAESALSQAGPRMAKSELFMPAREPDLMSLDAAARILRECGKRDQYTQHLLGQIHATLATLDTKTGRTQIQGLDFFRTIEQAVREERASEANRRRSGILVGVGVFAALVAVAAAVFYLIWRS